MGQGTKGDEIDTCLGIRNHRVESDATRRFSLGTTSHELDGLLRIFGREVVEHDAVATLGKSFLQFLPIAHLTLYLEILVMILAVLLGTADGVVDASAEVDVIVLKENHVEETNAVVHAATNLHSLLLEHTHTRGGLTGVEHAGLGACIDERLLIFVGHRGDAAHALKGC